MLKALRRLINFLGKLGLLERSMGGAYAFSRDSDGAEGVAKEIRELSKQHNIEVLIGREN